MMWLNRKKVDESQLAEEFLKGSLSISDPSGPPADSEIEKARRDLMIAQLEALKNAKPPVSPSRTDASSPPEVSDIEQTVPETISAMEDANGGSKSASPPSLPSPQSPQNQHVPNKRQNPQILRIPTLQSDLQAILEEIVRCDINRYQPPR